MDLWNNKKDTEREQKMIQIQNIQGVANWIANQDLEEEDEREKWRCQW